MDIDAIFQKILIVGDQEESLAVLQRDLKDFNVELTAASSCKDALTLISEHKYSVIIIDAELPVPDSSKVEEIICQYPELREIPVIVIVSEKEALEVMGRLQENSVTDYLFKPFEPTVLVSKVNLFLTFDRQKQELQTSIKEAEDASRLKSDFLANMSHELRSPLNSIILLSQMLAQNKKGELRDEHVQFAEIINRSGNDLLDLINDILDLSKIEAGKMDVYIRETEINELVDNIRYTYQHLAEEKGISLNISVADDLPEIIMTDQQKLEQVIRNFLSNAVKFTESGGILVEFKRPGPGLEKKEMVVSGDLSDPSSMIAISVKDTGIGIPEKSQKIIFEAFRQVDGGVSRKFGGTGLGLSISQELAGLIDGSIQLESIENKGAMFTVYIPESIKHHHNQRNERRSETREPLNAEGRKTVVMNIPDSVDESLLGKTVLTIEDDMRNLFTLSRILEDKQMNVHKAENGKTGLELLDKEHGVDLVLLDIMMPEMNGYEVVREIRKQFKYKTIPVVALTSNAMEGDREKCIQAGFDDYVPKPVDIENLFAVMGRLVKKG